MKHTRLLTYSILGVLLWYLFLQSGIHTTVAGVPAKIVGRPTTDKPSEDMDQAFNGKSNHYIDGAGI